MGKDTKYVDDLRVGFKKLVERGKSEREILRRLSLVIGAYLHSLLIIWPVLRSAFSGDDTFDSMVPMQLNYSDQSTWSYISQYTSNWARNEGRFFPGAATIGMFAHYLFTERAEYKIVQMLFVLAALTVFGIFVAKLFRSIYYGVVSVLILNISMQMRVQYDALFQFSLQQPSVVILLFTSFTFCFNTVVIVSVVVLIPVVLLPTSVDILSTIGVSEPTFAANMSVFTLSAFAVSDNDMVSISLDKIEKTMMNIKNKINPTTTKLQFVFKIFIRVLFYFILYEYFILIFKFYIIFMFYFYVLFLCFIFM